MSFTKFPDFQKLTIDNKPAYLQYYSLLKEPCSDLSLDNALIWLDYHNDLEVSDLNNNLVIRFTNVFDNNRVHYSLLGEFMITQTLDELFNYLRALTHTPRLSYLSEQVVNAIRKVHYSNIGFEEDIDNRDYVYKVEDLAKMQGKPYENLRGRVNNFVKDNLDITFTAFNLHNEDDRTIIESNILRWSEREEFLRNDPDKWELTAIHKHLQLAPNLSTQAYGLYVQGKLVCITIFHLPPQEKWMIINHIQCDYDYREVYGYATHRLSLVAQTIGIEWINFEQDLGKEGLKRIKTLFRPEKFLHRYTVSPGAGFIKYQ